MGVFKYTLKITRGGDFFCVKMPHKTIKYLMKKKHFGQEVFVAFAKKKNIVLLNYKIKISNIIKLLPFATLLLGIIVNTFFILVNVAGIMP